MSTLGDKLLRLKQRSGLSLAEVAAAGGYSGASSIQKLFRPDYDRPRLTRNTADRLIRAFSGRGTPPITAADVELLTVSGMHSMSHISQTFSRLAQDNPVIPISRTGNVQLPIEDDFNSQLMGVYEFSDHQQIFTRKPSHLQHRDIVGFIYTSSCMIPRYNWGEAIIIDNFYSPTIGNDVLITVKKSSMEFSALILGTLINVASDVIALRQLHPASEGRFQLSSVASIGRVMGSLELLPPLEIA